MTEEKTTTEARQAVTRKMPRRVLVISTLLSALALAAVLVWFFVYR